MRTTIETLSRCVCALALSGCLGTSSGNPADGDDGLIGPGHPAVNTDSAEFGDDGCVDDPMDVDADEVTELGFAAADILGFAAGVHVDTVTWNAPPNATLEPETGQGEITITVEPSGSAVYVASIPDPDIGGEIAVQCSGRLEIDVVVTLRTDGGALDETLDVTLIARNELLATAFLRPDPENLGGALSITPTREGYTLAQLDLQMNFTPFGISGTLDAILELRTTDAVGMDAVSMDAGGPGGPLASWGRGGDCDNGAFAVDTDQDVLGGSASDVLSILDAVQTADVTWGDGTSTTTSLGFTARDDYACAQLQSDPWGSSQAGMLTLAGDLAVESEDMRMSGSWRVMAYAQPASGDGGLPFERVSLAGDERYDDGQTDAEARYGFTGLDTEGLDSLFLDISIQYSPDGAGGVSLSGSFYLLGGMPVECNPSVEYDEDGNVVGMGGCPGGEEVIVVEAELTSAP